MMQGKMVRPRRLELPRGLAHSDLNAARLPIPPRPHSERALVYVILIPIYQAVLQTIIKNKKTRINSDPNHFFTIQVLGG